MSEVDVLKFLKEKFKATKDKDIKDIITSYENAENKIKKYGAMVMFIMDKW